MSKQSNDTGSRSDWVADKALRGLISTLLKLPYETRVRMMGSALRSAIGPLVGYRKRAEENLTLIYPDMPETERRRIAQGVCDNFGRTIIENYSHQELAARVKDTPMSGDGVEALKAAQSEGRSVLFVTGHFGNHEAPRHVLSHAGYDVGGLYRKMANPYFNAHYAKTMTSWGGPVFEQGRGGTMGFARHLKGGGLGTLLFDVNASGGIPVSFMGRTAMTAPSAAELAVRFDAMILPYFGTRQSDGLSFNVEIEAPIAHGPIQDMMEAMSQRLENRIKDRPEQWFWVHRRWKSQPKN